MAASVEVDVVLNQSNTHSESSKAKPAKAKWKGKKKEMVKLGNTQVIRESKNMSLRHLFNGLYHRPIRKMAAI